MASDGESLARAAGAAAALELVEAGMLLGLGSGRAVWALTDAVGARWPGLRVVVASEITGLRARTAGLEVRELDGEVRLDLALDGADEIGPRLGLIKGGGAALLREKLVVEAAARFVVVAEEAKCVARLGERWALPVEVVRFAWADTRRRLLELVPEAVLRLDDARATLVTDEGHLLLDCTLPPDGDVAALGAAIKATTGVVEHGLFLGMADLALLGRPDGTVAELGPS